MTIQSARRRRTLATATERLEDVGLHSGVPVWVRVEPGRPGTGIVFRDHGSGQEIPARAENVSDTTRCTQVRSGRATIQTVEHVLSALYGLNIDDAVVEVSGGELPAVDGSAAPYGALLMAAGIVDNDGFVEPITVDEPIEITDGRGGVLRVTPASELRMTVTLEYSSHPYIGTQSAFYHAKVDDYSTAIAPARTFGFLTELEQLHANGLALGASQDNALVLGEDRYLTPLRFENELARHKLLDLCGDLALAGKPLVAEVVAVKPGHKLNTRLAAILAGRG